MCRLLSVAGAAALFAACVVALPLSAQEPPAGEPLEATVVSVTGTAEVQLAPGAPWQPAQPGMKLAAGALITTGVKSTLELDFDGHAVVIVRRPSILRVDRFLLSERAVETRMHLRVGSLRAGVVKEQVASDFKITTHRVTLSARGTEITDVTHSDRGTEVRMGKEGRLDMTKYVGPVGLVRSIPADGYSRSYDLIRVVEEKQLEQSMQSFRYGRTEAEELSARMDPTGQDDPKAEFVRRGGHPEFQRRVKQETLTSLEAEP
jgi:hypothetical protein